MRFSKMERELFYFCHDFFAYEKNIKSFSSILHKTNCFALNDESFSIYYTSIDYACARDAAVCVVTVGSQSHEDQQPADYLEHNLKIFKDIIPNVSKYAPNSVLLILSKPGTSSLLYLTHR